MRTCEKCGVRNEKPRHITYDPASPEPYAEVCFRCCGCVTCTAALDSE